MFVPPYDLILKHLLPGAQARRTYGLGDPGARVERPVGCVIADCAKGGHFA